MKSLLFRMACLAFLAILSASCGTRARNDNKEPLIVEPEQKNDFSDYSLEVSGLVDKPGIFTYEELVSREKSRKAAALNCVDGWNEEALWEGFRLSDLLYELGIDSRANTVIFYARDGFSTSLPLNYIMSNNIIMAYKKNGAPVQAIFQLVAEEKWGYKWIKLINKIELSDNKDYQGAYESVGYSIDGDLSKSFRNK
ncbi:MAG TPA: molybdopterin-dependent oxidoreductase [archaeon]|nr:molybdopterin-dependent oxidoreductase [archaeon]